MDEVVYAPYVENHQAELEVRSARELGGPSGGNMTTVLEGEVGLNDRLSLALVGTLERSRDQSLQLTGVGVEAIVYIGQIPGLGVDTGGYLEYTQGFRGGPDVIEGKLLLAKQVERFQGLLNLIVERPVSGPGGEQFASYGYAASATWRTVGALAWGPKHSVTSVPTTTSVDARAPMSDRRSFGRAGQVAVLWSWASTPAGCSRWGPIAPRRARNCASPWNLNINSSERRRDTVP